MGTKTTKNNEAIKPTEMEAIKPTEFPNIIGKIVKVITPEANEDRITFVVDSEFITIDKRTGERKLTNKFGLNIYSAVSQIGAMVTEIQLADALAMGKMVNPQIITLAMINADVVVSRTFKAKGETRENTNDIYAEDCITSKFINVIPHIAPKFEAMLMQLISTKPAVVKEVTFNPFNV